MLHTAYIRHAGAIGLALTVLMLAACSPAPTPTPAQAEGGVSLMPALASDESGAPPAQAPEGDRSTILSPEEAMNRHAQQYADEQGISLDEAIHRLSLQGEISELSGALEANERETFAGLWIQHQPEYRVVVRFTEGGEETIRRYVEGGPLAELIELRPAELTLDELRAIQDEVTDLALELGILATAGINVQEGVVELGITDQAKLEASGATLPDHVVVSVVGELPQPLPAQ
jgi:hypothetical protein